MVKGRVMVADLKQLRSSHQPSHVLVSLTRNGDGDHEKLLREESRWDGGIVVG